MYFALLRFPSTCIHKGQNNRPEQGVGANIVHTLWILVLSTSEARQRHYHDYDINLDLDPMNKHNAIAIQSQYFIAVISAVL